jgi:hypothetical protein
MWNQYSMECICVLILFAWDKRSTMFILCFGSWGAQTIHYFEIIWLVEGPFSARFNQHGSSVFIKCLWPTIDRWWSIVCTRRCSVYLHQPTSLVGWDSWFIVEGEGLSEVWDDLQRNEGVNRVAAIEEVQGFLLPLGIPSLYLKQSLSTSGVYFISWNLLNL